jgi:hypothetical protein
MAVADAGFELIDGLLTADEVEELLADLTKLQLDPLRGGIRRIEQLVPRVAALARSQKLLSVATGHLPGQPELVRAIYFDKSPGNNWYVTWHQDQTVAVSGCFDHESWGPWSTKAGAWHVQPPLEVLDQMVTIRIHLDAATVANGCLKVMPGSHRTGLIDVDRMHEHVNRDEVIYCESRLGGAVVMRPHILHASEKSVASDPRRILHFEYSSYQLPDGVTWSD